MSSLLHHSKRLLKSKECTKIDNNTFNLKFNKKEICGRNSTNIFKFPIMSSRCPNHMALNLYKFNIVCRTAGLHFHSTFSFQRSQNTETFSTLHKPHHGMIHHGWGMGISPITSPPMWSWQSFESTGKMEHNTRNPSLYMAVFFCYIGPSLVKTFYTNMKSLKSI